MSAPARERLQNAIDANPVLSAVVGRWHEVQLPDGWLAAGAIAQTVWNLAHGRAPGTDIRDIDLVYFDAADHSSMAEQRHEERIRRLFVDQVVIFDVKNQARVHQWYAAKFGYAIEPYASIEDAIATFPTTATAVGVRPAASGLEVCAPFGLDDLLGLVVRPNKAQVTQSIYEAKVARWRPCWPNLTFVDWNAAA